MVSKAVSTVVNPGYSVRMELSGASAMRGFLMNSPYNKLQAVRKVSRGTFETSLDLARKLTRNGKTVGQYVDPLPTDLRDTITWTYFLTEDGTCGGACQPSGFLSHLFNVGDRGFGRVMQVVRVGYQVSRGRVPRLFCYESLVDLYSTLGWKPYDTAAWNPVFAPDDWQGNPEGVTWMWMPRVSPEMRRSEAYRKGVALADFGGTHE
jgi:hypothetical protein